MSETDQLVLVVIGVLVAFYLLSVLRAMWDSILLALRRLGLAVAGAMLGYVAGLMLQLGEGSYLTAVVGALLTVSLVSTRSRNIPAKVRR